MKQEHAIDLRKAAIIGCGFVGSATAFTLMQSKLFSELVLIDVDKARAEGEAMDIRDVYKRQMVNKILKELL